MEITKTTIEGLIILQPKVFKDERGYFLETFNEKVWNNHFENPLKFVQDNESLSKKHVLRGLHFQCPPFAQGKLVRVTQGAVIDVAVDLREDSPTYGKHIKVLLNDSNHKQFYIPPGFAHGFVALEENTRFAYKCTNFYNQKSEGAILWNDPDLGIDWEVLNPLVSEKDAKSITFAKFDTPF